MRKAAIRDALFEKLEGVFDTLYDFLFHVYGDEAAAQEALQFALKKAMKRYPKERYERYLRLWALRLAVEVVERGYPRYLSEQKLGHEATLPYLSLEEKLTVLLHDRCGCSYEEIASVMQIPVGRVGRSLTYAREKIGSVKFGLRWTKGESLLSRIELNHSLDKEDVHEGAKGIRPCEQYVDAVAKSRDYVRELPRKSFSEIESTVRTQQILPIFTRPSDLRWRELPWQYKLGAEAMALGVIGVLAVVVLPWSFSKINTKALFDGRFADVLNVSDLSKPEQAAPEISADRLLASTDSAEQGMNPVPEENDEFANMDFPSGDSYETGAAPVAPSRQSAAVFRLIVQSPNPSDLIPSMRSLFQEKNVKERDSSGRVMPGGVYFDGITSVGAYPKILEAIEKLGKTKTYSNSSSNRKPDERARLIVWIQQI